MQNVFIQPSYVTIAPPPPSTHQQASMYTFTIVGGGREPCQPAPTPEYLLTQHSYKETPHPSNTQQHTTTHNNTQQQYTTALEYIKLPMYQALKISTFLGPNGTRLLVPFQGPKKVSIFRAHPFQCPS
jgi:hypothetical protein